MLIVRHSNNIVTVTEQDIDQSNYDAQLNLAHHVLRHFSATNSNTWGCDGVGYAIEKAKGSIRVMKSTIGPRNFKKGLEAIKNCSICKSEVSHE